MNKLKIIRCKLLVFLTHNLALPALKKFRKAKLFPYNMQQLQQMPNGTLGNDLYKFIKAKNLQLLTHYARHDLKHIVLNFDTTEEGELCLQSFMLGNGRISFPVLATVCFGLFTAPEHWGKMYNSFAKGRQSNNIHKWQWFTLLQWQTLELRNLITIKNDGRNNN